MARRHVHIGTGRFGLGFVGDFSKKFGLSLVLSNRMNTDSEGRNKRLSEDKYYYLQFYDQPGTPPATIEFQEFYFFTETSSDSLAEVIRDPATVLVTTSVTEPMLSDVAGIISKGLEKRKTGNPLFIIACENGVSCSTTLRKLVNNPNTDAIFVNTIVDRICSNLELSKPIIVHAESYSEWIVDGANESIKDVLKDPSVKFVPEYQLEWYNLRKLWLINGFHLALSVLGVHFLKNVKARISDVLGGQNEKLAIAIKDVKSDLVNALTYKKGSIFSFNDLASYIATVEERFRYSDDDCERHLKDILTTPKRMEAAVNEFSDALRHEALPKALNKYLHKSAFRFFEKVKERIYDPLTILLDEKQTPKDKEIVPKGLSLVLNELTPFMVQQGKQLKS